MREFNKKSKNWLRVCISVCYQDRELEMELEQMFDFRDKIQEIKITKVMTSLHPMLKKLKIHL